MKKKGFTLVEALVVIAIIGIIILVAIPAVLNNYDKSRRDAMVIQENQLLESGDILVRDFCTNPINDIYQLQCDSYFKSTPDIETIDDREVYTKYLCLSDLKQLGYYDEELKFSGNSCSGVVIYKVDALTDKQIDSYSYVRCGEDYNSSTTDSFDYSKYSVCFPNDQDAGVDDNVQKKYRLHVQFRDTTAYGEEVADAYVNENMTNGSNVINIQLPTFTIDGNEFEPFVHSTSPKVNPSSLKVVTIGDHKYLRGDMPDHNLAVTIVYSIKKYSLTVNYKEFQTGIKMDEPYSRTLFFQEPFTLPVKNIENYKIISPVDRTITMGQSDKVVDVIYQKINFNLTYDEQGGSPQCTDGKVKYEGQFGTLCSNVTRTGYRLAGWYTGANGTGSKVESTTVHNNYNDVTLYAKWNPNTYTVSYNCNGGSGSTAASSHTYDVTSPLNTNGCTRTGYHFVKWTTSADGSGTSYANSVNVTNLSSTHNGNVTLYAQWERNNYTVKYSCNGGSGTTANSSHTYGVYANLTSNGCTRPGYSFDGWATSSSGEKVYSDKESVVNLTTVNNGTFNLYAKWTQCAAGYSSTGLTCVKCGENTYSGAGASSCSSCPGSYVSPAGTTSINGCYLNVSAGKYVATANSSTQTACGTGTYKTAHKVNYGSTSSCSPCPSGYQNGAGTTSQANCSRTVAAGYYIASANATTNTACATGTYKAQHTVKYGGTSSCSACPSGYTAGAGATAESGCQISVSAGKYIGTAKSTTQSTCANGTYKTAHTVNYGSTSSCSDCPSGYTNGAGATSQANCKRSVAAGYYVASANATSNTACPSGKISSAHTVNYGSTSSCTNCEAGTTSTTGSSTCTTCSAGKYNTSAGSSSCLTCPAGSYCQGGTHIATCPAGKYSASGASSCSTCEPGYYCSGGASRAACPSGYTSDAGATAQSSCYISVSAGKYIATANSSTQTACGTGTYKTAHKVNYGSTSSCTTCPSGYRDGSGATAESNCSRTVAAGYYIASANATTNTACATGTYKAQHTVKYGSTSSCSACPSGYTAGAGATAESGCQISVSAGKYIGTAKSTTQSTCANGTYKTAHKVNYGSTSSCSSCPSGYTAGAGATAESGCQISVSAGKYIGTAKSSTQSSCGTGTYKTSHTVNYGSTSSCSSCPSGYTAGSGATAESGCQISVSAGKYIGTAKSSTQSSCGTGTYKTAHTVNYGSTSSCSSCPSGYTAGSGATAESGCKISVSAGKYIGTAKSTTQSSCGTGTYKTAHTVNYGSTSSCSSCPSGYTAGSGATAETGCQISVSAGKYIASASSTTQSSCSIGTYKEAHKVNYGSTSSCSACPSGYTNGAGTTAKANCSRTVSAGYYIASANATSNTKCANGTYKTEHSVKYGSTSSCSACPSGYTAASGATAETGCQISVSAGKYIGTAKSTTQSSCGTGTYKTAHTVNYGSTSSCSSCPSGYTNGAGTTAESNCSRTVAAGYYIATAKATTNTACPAGKIRAAHTVNYGSTSSCTNCDSGTSSTAGSSTCTTCEAGYYCSGGTAKVACPSGYTSAAGATAKSSCYISVSAGKYIATANSSTQTACGTGTYKTAHKVYYGSTSSCTTCPSGYRDGSGATAESNCSRTVAAGYYLATAKATSNTACGNGTYKGSHSVKYGSTSSCSGCPTNYDDGAGATSQSGCKWNVPGGKYISTANATSASTCAAGKYKAAHTVSYGGTSSCSSCSAGYYSSSGASSCTACSSKTYSVAGATGCYTCEAGYYCPGASARQSCPSGYTSSTAAAAQTDCYINVSGGYYLGTANSTTLSKCAAGKYKAGHTVKYGSTSSCSNCAAGSYSAAGASSCTTCPAGKYNTSAASTSCSSCPANYYCTGGANKTACASGYTSPAGSDAASDCVLARKNKTITGQSGEIAPSSYKKDCGQYARLRFTWKQEYTASTNTSKFTITDMHLNTYGKCTGVFWTGGLDDDKTTKKKGVYANGTQVEFMSAWQGSHFFSIWSSGWSQIYKGGEQTPGGCLPFDTVTVQHDSNGKATVPVFLDFFITTDGGGNYFMTYEESVDVTLTSG